MLVGSDGGPFCNRSGCNFDVNGKFQGPFPTGVGSTWTIIIWVIFTWAQIEQPLGIYVGTSIINRTALSPLNTSDLCETRIIWTSSSPIVCIVFLEIRIGVARNGFQFMQVVMALLCSMVCFNLEPTLNFDKQSHSIYLPLKSLSLEIHHWELQKANISAKSNFINRVTIWIQHLTQLMTLF